MSQHSMSWAKAEQDMRERVDETARTVTGGFPNYADPQTGEWTTASDGHWTGGHWIGQLWLYGRSTGEAHYTELGRKWCRMLEPRAYSNTIFRGFLFYYGAALGHILVGDDTARRLALAGAEGLMHDYNPEAGVIPLGTAAEEASNVGDRQTNIDAVGAISSLCGWASKISGDSTFRDAAVQHAKRHIEFCVRDDGSVCQSASFDPHSGKLVHSFSHKGYSEGSTWARAQAWGMLAYVLSARWMPEHKDFIDTASRVADWWLDHLPENLVAFWDFSDPGIPGVEKDTSATAIAAAALLKLAELTPDANRRERYRERARDTVRVLISDYLTPTHTTDKRPTGILTHGCYNKHINVATYNELVWGDYYLLEALHVLNGTINAADI